MPSSSTASLDEQLVGIEAADHLGQGGIKDAGFVVDGREGRSSTDPVGFRASLPYLPPIMSDTEVQSARTVVLVVEDEAFVRAMVVDVLEDEGFEVIEASSADYAVNLLHSRDDISAVFTDISMPGKLNGLDLARLVRTMYPQIAVIVATGALPPGVTDVGPEIPVLRKPYRVSDVVQTVRRAGGGVPRP